MHGKRRSKDLAKIKLDPTTLNQVLPESTAPWMMLMTQQSSLPSAQHNATLTQSMMQIPTIPKKVIDRDSKRVLRIQKKIKKFQKELEILENE